MTHTDDSSPYTTGTTRSNIRNALLAAGKDLDHLQLADLGMLEDFHTNGRLATMQLADLVDIKPDSAVLDAGAATGGTARYLADRFGCTVTAIDRVEEYCDTARWINALVGLTNQISVHCGDVADLPFPDATFQVVFSQHVQMNVADKHRLYQETRRVLAAGGQLAIWDLTAADDTSDARTGSLLELDYPLPWADRPGQGHLVTAASLRESIEAAGFAIERWTDLTDHAAETMRMVLSLPPSPLGLHVFVPGFGERVRNLTAAIANGHIRAIQAIARAA
jgi:sarcosine/dimethylglycine N-methyltransferase